MADRVAELIARRGDALARGQMERGRIFGDTIRNVGFTFANLPQQLQQARAAEQEMAAKTRAEQEDQQLRALFDSGQPPTPEAIMRIVGPERGARIAAGLAALRPDPRADFQRSQEILRDVVLGMDALSESQRAEFYPGVRQNLVTRGVIKEADAPAAYDPAWWQTTRQYGQQPAKTEGFTLGEGQTRFDASGRQVAAVPKSEKQPDPVKLGSEEDYIKRFATAIGKTVEQLTPGQIDTARRRYAQQTRFVEPKTAATVTLSKGDQLMDVPKADVNEFYAQGWKPYDQVAARQTNTASQSEALDTAREAHRLAKALRQHKGLSGAFGIVDSWFPTVMQDTADAEVLRDSLTGLLTLENTGKLKGVLSNADMEILRNASTTLKAKMGDAAARAELDRLQKVMERAVTALGGSIENDEASGPVSVTTPDGQTFTFPDQQSADAFKRAAGVS